MPTEPLTIFARIADPARVAVRLRELLPTVEIDGSDNSWHRAVVTVGRWPRKKTLTFKHNPDYYAEPGWSTQLSGMQGYFSRFPETPRKQRVLMLISSFRFALATEFEPDYDPDGDPRLEIVFQITELLDGVLFTPSSLRDCRGRVLFGAGGAVDEDPEAIWPRVLGEVSTAEPVGAAMHAASRPVDQDIEGTEGDPPSPVRLARRALALTAVTARALLENEAAAPEAPATYEKLRVWVRDIQIDDEFENDERLALHQPVGHLPKQLHVESSWRLEGLIVLAWALGRIEIPPYDEMVQANVLWRSLGFMNLQNSQALLSQPQVRTRDEMASLRKRLFALHWRLRNFDLDPKVMDFESFAKTSWFGPLDLSGVRLADGDLEINGHRIDRAPEGVVAQAHSIAQERHLAVNWLWEGPERYSEASVAT